VYSGLALVAQNLITKFGATCVLTRTTGSVLDPVTGLYSTGTTTTITCKAVRLNYSKTEIDGQLVQRSDMKFYINTQGGAPAIGDNVLFDSVNYRVMDVRPLNPAGEVVYYELQLRA
jgi:hypothetical protein